MYLHTYGDLKKIAACKVKLLKLLDRNEHDESAPKKEVMLEDGPENVKNLSNELKDDRIGASYLKMAQKTENSW